MVVNAAMHRSAEAAPPHGEVQRLCAYSAHPERSASGAQRRCGIHIRGIVLYFYQLCGYMLSLLN
jgi:hypothetical protein